MLSRWLIIVLSVFLLVGAGYAAQRELAVQGTLAGTDTAFFEKLAASVPEAPLSIRNADAIVRRCIAVPGGLYGSLQPSQTATLARQHCLDLSKKLIDDMPSFPAAWYAAALLSYQLDNPQEGETYLAMAQQVGRHEQWLTEGRVQLAEQYFDQLSPATLAAHHTDLELLARSGRGVRSIAFRYVNQPAFRERITQIVETLSPEEQRRFIANVRNAATQFGMAPSNEQ